MKSTKSNIVSLHKRLAVSAAVALACGLAMPPTASANDDEAEQCSTRTLRGVFMFRASGFNIVNGAALPKAILETLVFDGYGNVSTPAVSISVNGTIIQPPQGSSGIYTVDYDCTGTLTFSDGPKFDLQIRPNGRDFNMLQTNPNTVMQGVAEKVKPLSAWRG